jgi:hypothetical protein
MVRTSSIPDTKIRTGIRRHGIYCLGALLEAYSWAYQRLWGEDASTCGNIPLPLGLKSAEEVGEGVKQLCGLGRFQN